MELDSPPQWPRIAYTCSFDDVVESTLRMYGHMPQMRRIKRTQMITSAVALLLTGGVILWLDRPTDWLEVGIFAVLLVPVFLGLRWQHDRTIRHRIRAFVRDVLNGRNQVECEIVLYADKAHSNTGGTEVAYPWESGTAVDDHEKGVDLVFRSGLLWAPTQVFADPAEQRRFAVVARALMKLGS